MNRIAFIEKVEKLNLLIIDESGLFVKFDVLKQIFTHENISLYLKIESQSLLTNPYVAAIFKLYFNINFFEISKFAISINSVHLSKFDVVSRV